MAMARLRATTGVGAITINWSYRATICDQSVCSSVAASAWTALIAAGFDARRVGCGEDTGGRSPDPP
jgi:hypothetical protein